ncbi:hypothetical protein BH11PLA1_BH11PLA1_14160 [soil metagenome]
MDRAAQFRTLISEIACAFTGASRAGGISWSESCAIDFHTSRAAARDLDKDTCWQSLIDAPGWPASGGTFVFLDPIGFRYYFPAAMTVELTARLFDDFGPLELSFFCNIPPSPNGVRKSALNRFSLFTPAQLAVTRRFVDAMRADALAREDEDEFDLWTDAWQSHWCALGQPQESPS